MSLKGLQILPCSVFCFVFLFFSSPYTYP